MSSGNELIEFIEKQAVREESNESKDFIRKWDLWTCYEVIEEKETAGTQGEGGI